MFIFITIVPVTTKFGRMVPYLEGLPTIKSFNALIIGLAGYVTNKSNYISSLP